MVTPGASDHVIDSSFVDRLCHSTGAGKFDDTAGVA